MSGRLAGQRKSVDFDQSVKIAKAVSEDSLTRRVFHRRNYEMKTSFCFGDDKKNDDAIGEPFSHKGNYSSTSMVETRIKRSKRYEEIVCCFFSLSFFL